MRTFNLLAALAASTLQVLAQTNNEAWDAAYARAESALSQLTQEEKIGMVTGIGWNQGPNGPCVGNTSPVSSIDYPELCLHDGPQGIRFGSSVTAFTPAIQAAATWDVDLIRQRGSYMGTEFHDAGIHVILGPAPGALGKNAEGGRNWEGFAPDPYLQGIATQVTVEALQEAGVQAAAKHYIVNEQEVNREEVSSNVDDRTMHELYLWPFADAIRANAASMMCSYNRVNGTHACENSDVMQRLLKEEMGFPGYVMSDWFVAQRTTVGSANAGMDMSMPGSAWGGGEVIWGPQLQSAIDNGDVEQSRVDDMVLRILAAYYLVGQDEGFPEEVNIDADVQGNHAENVRACARDGTVLLKNEDSILPLQAPGSIAVIGSSSIQNPNGINSCEDHGCNEGALGMGWGSGAVDYPYLVAPLDAIEEQAEADGTEVITSSTDSTSEGAAAASGADVAIVFVTANSGEGYLTVEGHPGDRTHLDPWNDGNELVAAVAEANENVIVVVHSTGAVLLEEILSHDSVKAIVWGGLPSQENGNAVVDILWGSTNPNGKLPYTIAQSWDDYSSRVVQGANDNFDEGLYVDYRHFDAQGIEPRYEFGFGLSYTTFEFSDLSVDSSASSGPATGDVVPGGREDLFAEVATVTATVTNDGEVDGAEVAQLYITLPSSAPETPPQQLRGFTKLPLEAGESGTATFSLRRKDLSYWDTASQNWIVPSGTFGVKVGASSRDIRLEGELVVS